MNTGMVGEAGLRDWAAWAAQHDATYHLGATPAAVLSTVDRTYHASAGQPLRIGPYLVDDSALVGAIREPLNSDADLNNQTLANTVMVFNQAATTGDPQPIPKNLDDTLKRLLTGANSSQFSAYAAIMCADATVPRDPESYWRDIQAHRASEPMFGPLNRNITPCAFWPTTNGQPVTVSNAVPALVVGAAGDIGAVLSHQQALHRALTASRMITLNVRTHLVYLYEHSTCVNDAVNTYLTTGHLPAQDLTCPRPADR